MSDRMIPRELPIFIFEDGAELVLAYGSTLREVIQSAASAQSIRLGSQNGKTTTAMRNFADTLRAIRCCSEDEIFSHLCCAASDAYEEVRRDSRMRLLTGLSADESTLIIIFVSPWIGECLVQVQTEMPEQSLMR